MPKYRWNTAHEWLLDKVDQYKINNNHNELADLLYSIIPELDPDIIVDTFQGDMDKDGYFKPIKEEV